MNTSLCWPLPKMRSPPRLLCSSVRTIAPHALPELRSPPCCLPTIPVPWSRHWSPDRSRRLSPLQERGDQGSTPRSPLSTQSALPACQPHQVERPLASACFPFLLGPPPRPSSALVTAGLSIPAAAPALARADPQPSPPLLPGWVEPGRPRSLPPEPAPLIPGGAGADSTRVSIVPRAAFPRIATFRGRRGLARRSPSAPRGTRGALRGALLRGGAARWRAVLGDQTRWPRGVPGDAEGAPRLGEGPLHEDAQFQADARGHTTRARGSAEGTPHVGTLKPSVYPAGPGRDSRGPTLLGCAPPEHQKPRSCMLPRPDCQPCDQHPCTAVLRCCSRLHPVCIHQRPRPCGQNPSPILSLRAQTRRRHPLRVKFSIPTTVAGPVCPLPPSNPDMATVLLHPNTPTCSAWPLCPNFPPGQATPSNREHLASERVTFLFAYRALDSWCYHILALNWGLECLRGRVEAQGGKWLSPPHSGDRGPQTCPGLSPPFLNALKSDTLSYLCHLHIGSQGL